MTEREFKYIDMEKINKRIAESTEPPITDEPSEVLYGTMLDLLQVAFNEGMAEEEIDVVMRRVIDYRARMVRERFRLHTKNED